MCAVAGALCAVGERSSGALERCARALDGCAGPTERCRRVARDVRRVVVCGACRVSVAGVRCHTEHYDWARVESTSAHRSVVETEHYELS